MLINACNAQEKPKKISNKFDSKFRSYWYEGKAEITTYPLSTQELPTPAVMFFTTSNQGMVLTKGAC